MSSVKNLVLNLCVALVAVSAVPSASTGGPLLIKFFNRPYNKVSQSGSFNKVVVFDSLNNNIGRLNSNKNQLPYGTKVAQRDEAWNQEGLQNTPYVVLVGAYLYQTPSGDQYLFKYVSDENNFEVEAEEQPPGSSPFIAESLIGGSAG